MSRPQVAFVCRGSVADGFGHLIRSAVVASAVPPEIGGSLIAVGDASAEQVLAGFGVPSRVVDSDSALVPLVEGVGADAVIFDMVSIEPGALETLGRDRITASLSPIFSALDRMDLVFSRTRFGRGGAVVHDPERGRYCGPEYAVVRPGCRRIDTGTFARHLDETDLSIAISMGGADAANRTLAVLAALRELEAPAIFWTILGEGYGHSYRQLVDCVRRDTRHEIILAKTNRSMWRTLGNCSLAILAGGVTTYEAAFAGLPSVNVLAAAEDHFLISDLVERGVAFDGGVQDESLTTLVDTTATLASDREALLAAHRSSRSVVDGRGAERIHARIAERLGVSPSAQAALT